MIRPYILAESNWKSVKDAGFDLAVLPWGATEAHNYHLPYATDNILAENIAAEAARIAWEKGGRPVVLPNIPFGVNTGQLDIRLDMNIYPSTQLIILNDIVENLNRHGIKKLVILNSHGGNDFRIMARELGAKYPEMFICVCNWFQWKGRDDFFEHKGDHADEMETSLLLHLRPELVLPLDEAGEGKEKKHKIEALRQGWFWAERRWSQVTEDTGIGDPKASTADKGKRFFETITEKVAAVLLELAQNDINNMYE
ncbi:creatininase [Proteiniphilum saccharofermentans]|uniref:Creatininase n=1 Tax=Proteiniphilum saccharofermentans TaxID=1642647 RepID=A0A1R3SW73_9BACT|nr:creatininase family protein [Proteiniphilum saccharofermentans]SCD20533.1 creatininase [Proteiniphilum saccharofermentans]